MIAGRRFGRTEELFSPEFPLIPDQNRTSRASSLIDPGTRGPSRSWGISRLSSGSADLPLYGQWTSGHESFAAVPSTSFLIIRNQSDLKHGQLSMERGSSDCLQRPTVLPRSPSLCPGLSSREQCRYFRSLSRLLERVNNGPFHI